MIRVYNLRTTKTNATEVKPHRSPSIMGASPPIPVITELSILSTRGGDYYNWAAAVEKQLATTTIVSLGVLDAGQVIEGKKNIEKQGRLGNKSLSEKCCEFRKRDAETIIPGYQSPKFENFISQ